MAVKIKRTLSAPLLALICYALMILSGFIKESELRYRDNIYLSVIVIQILIFIIPGIIYCKLGGEKTVKGLRLRTFGLNKLLFCVFSVCTLISASGLVKLGLYELGYSSPNYTLYANYLPTSMSGFTDIVYIILAIAVLPALTEEFVFRGIILSEYRASGCKNYAAVAFSTVLFGMIHFSLGQLPVYLLGGATFAIIMIVTDSLPAAMLAHIINNAFSLLFESTLLRLINQSDSMIFVMFIFGTAFLIFLIVTLHLAEKIYLSRALSGENTAHARLSRKKQKGLSPELEALISPAFLACIALFVLRVLKVF